MPSGAKPPAKPERVKPGQPKPLSSRDRTKLDRAKLLVTGGTSVREAAETVGLPENSVEHYSTKEDWATPARVRKRALAVQENGCQMVRQAGAGDLTDCERAVLEYFAEVEVEVTVVHVDKLGNVTTPRAAALLLGEGKAATPEFPPEVIRETKVERSGEAGEKGSIGAMGMGMFRRGAPRGFGSRGEGGGEGTGEVGKKGTGVHSEFSGYDRGTAPTKTAEPTNCASPLGPSPVAVATQPPATGNPHETGKLGAAEQALHNEEMAEIIRRAVHTAHKLKTIVISKPSELATLDSLYRRLTGQDKAPAGTGSRPMVNIQILSGARPLRRAPGRLQTVSRDTQVETLVVEDEEVESE